MRKSTILIALRLLSEERGSLPGWKAVNDRGIKEEDIFRHWDGLAEAEREALHELNDAEIEVRGAKEEEHGSLGFSVYVIRLRAKVAEVPKFLRENPSGTRECLYVGSTGLTPEDRLDRHLSGHQTASKIAHAYGIDLHRPLTDPKRFKFKTRPIAEVEEAAYARHLRKQGFRVWQR